MQYAQIGGEKPVIDNEKGCPEKSPATEDTPRHLILQYRDKSLFVEKVIRDDRTDVLMDIMVAVELVVNAMGFDVELGVNADGDFVFYDDCDSDECFGDDADEDKVADGWDTDSLVGHRVRILVGVLQGQFGTVNSFENGLYGVILDSDTLLGRDEEIAYAAFELEVIG